jgi:nucleotide-binding universal stress UspA family protein
MPEDLVPTPRPVLVGVKQLRQAALRYALEEADRLGTSVRVAHVIPDAELALLNGATPEIVGRVRSVVDAEPRPPRVDVLTWWGDPVDVLVAESREAELLVLSGDELPWITRMAGGEVTRRLALTAQCPVVVVPATDSNPDRVGGVVVAVDGSGPMDAPLLFGFRAAHLRGEALQIVIAAGSPQDRLGREARGHRLSALIAEGERAFPEVVVLPPVSADRGVTACLWATQHASLLVLGRPMDDHAPWSPLGVAGRVLRRAKSPVTVIPLDHAVATIGAA